MSAHAAAYGRGENHKDGSPIDGRRDKNDRYRLCVRAGELIPSDWLGEDGNPLPMFRELVAKWRKKNG